MRTLILLAALCFSFIACQQGEDSGNTQDTGGTQTAAASNAPLAAKGGQTYATYCKACHGADGQAGIGGAKNLAASSLDKAGVKAIIANGSANKKMMAYGKLLSEEELGSLAEYVMGLRP